MRLTYKAQDQHGKETGTVWYASIAGNNIFPKSDKEEQVLKKLAAYEDAEEQGRLVILPCKVGDTVYYLNPFDEIENGKITMIQQKVDGTWKFRVTTDFSRDMTVNAIGKTVFFTREEAEVAQKKGKNNVDELMKLARHCAEKDACINCPVGGCSGPTGLMNKLANAIEELNKRAQEWEMIAESWRKACKGLEDRIPSWVSVTKQLPEKKREVYWCLTDGGYCYEVRWTNCINGLVESDDWGWSMFDVPQFSHVTHWMPRLELPKEEA